MIKPTDIEDDAWAVINAAADGDVAAMRRLLDHDPTLSRKGYFYTPPIHFAVREGHPEIVQMLLDAGADPNRRNEDGYTPYTIAQTKAQNRVVELFDKRQPAKP